MSSHRKTPAPNTLQLVINQLAARIVPAAVIHAWLAARRAGADRRRRTPALVLGVGALVAAAALLPGSGASAQAGPRTVVVKASPSAVAVEASEALHRWAWSRSRPA